MTTWTVVTPVSTDYDQTGDEGSGYVADSYIEEGYFEDEGLWTEVTPSSTVWVAA